MFAAASYRAFDPDEYTSLIRGARVEVVVAARGTFDATITRLDLGGLWMQRGSECLPRTFRAVLSADRVMLWFLGGPQAHVTMLSSDIAHDDLALLGPGEAACWRSHAPSEWASMSLPTDSFQEYGATLIGRDVMRQEFLQVLLPPSDALARLHRLHRATVDLAETAPDAVCHPEAVRGLRHHLIQAAFAAIGGGHSQVSVRECHLQRIMARFEALIEANPDRAMYMTEVCKAVGATERTFRTCCQDYLGMSPIRYLTLRRLHQVHRELRNADARTATVTVTDIATRHGFWELGRFSMSYRELFAELPSTTLHRMPEDCFLLQNRSRPLEISEFA
jgi:AraC-like DNA-binding protein